MRALLLVLLSIPLSVMADPTLPYRADYDVFRGSMNLGGGYYELVDLGDNNYRLGYQSDVSFLLLSDTRTEQSSFQRVDGQLIPLQYSMKRSGTGSDFSASMRFNHLAGKVFARYKDRTAEFEITPSLYDVLLYQQKLREELAAGKQEMLFSVAYKTRIREYRYRIIDKETITVPMGSYEAIKVERVRDPKKQRTTYFWVVPSLNFVVARLAHYEDGELQAEMQLKKLKFHEPATAKTD